MALLDAALVDALSANPLAAATGDVAGRGTLVALLLAAASVAWWIARRRMGRFRPAGRGAAPVGPTLTGADLELDLGSRATFVQFSSATCATCPQVRRTLSGLAAAQPGVEHVEVQSEDRMDLVRRFGVYRTPTVLLLDGHGAVRSRTSGPLTTAQALAALHHLTSAHPDDSSRAAPRSIDA